MEHRLKIRHDGVGLVGVEVKAHLTERKTRPGKLGQGELKEGLVVGLEVDLASGAQDLPIGLQKGFVGKPPFGMALAGPGVTEVDIHPLDLPGGKPVGEQGGVIADEHHIGQLQRLGPLHGHHQGVGHPLHRQKQHIRLPPGGLHRKAALAAAQFQPYFRTARQLVLPAALPVRRGLLLPVGAGLHPRLQVLLFPQSHQGILPSQIQLK